MNQIKQLMSSNVEDDFKLGVILADKQSELKEILYETEDPEIWEKILPLNGLRSLQKQFPQVFVAGSVGLFLHGVRLSRWTERIALLNKGQKLGYGSDLDIISPYYVNLENNEELNTTTLQNYSGYENDFTEYVVGTDMDLGFQREFKIELRINPSEKYETVEYGGYKYKVSKLSTIVKEKVKYCFQKGNYQKHVRDFEDICGKTYYESFLKKKNENNK